MSREFRVIGDTIEFDGVAVATILPSAWPTLRDDVEMALYGATRGLEEERDDLIAQVRDLEDEVRRLQDELGERDE